MSSIAKYLLYLTFLFPSLLLFVMSVMYDKQISPMELGFAIVMFMLIFLIKG